MSFWRDTRAAATALTAIVIALMTIGAGALITDHVVLVDQRDTLKDASSSAAIAATQEMDRLLEADSNISNNDLKAALKPIARGYIVANLLHLPKDRYDRAIQTLVVKVRPNRSRGTVDVRAEADLGGFLFAPQLPLLGGVNQIEAMVGKSGVKSATNPVEVVLAIDVSGSMRNPLEGGQRQGVDSRMMIVKKAARQLVDILDPTGSNRVAIGVVPWTVAVRLDSATARKWRRKGWARYPKRRTYPIPYRCTNCTITPVVHKLPVRRPDAWEGCLDGHRMAGRTAIPEISTPDLLEPPSTTPFAQSYFPAWHGLSYQCLASSEIPAGAVNYCWETLNLAQGSCALPTIFSLSTDRSSIERAIDSLSANGSTHSALGILWGQRLLSHAWKPVWGTAVHPVDPDANPDLRKVIVLLTDGEDNYCGLDNAACEASPLTISRTDACTHAKAEGTEIFVITAMHPNKVSGDLARTLRECSSEADHPDGTYVFLNNATPERLKEAFADIARQLTSIRRVY